MNFCPRRGANSETQWYCPPAVGALSPLVPLHDARLRTYIEAISAILAYTRENPNVTPMKPHINPAVPPSVKPSDSNLFKVSCMHYFAGERVMQGAAYVNITSQVQIRVHPKPTIEMKRKFLLTKSAKST